MVKHFLLAINISVLLIKYVYSYFRLNWFDVINNFLEHVSKINSSSDNFLHYRK